VPITTKVVSLNPIHGVLDTTLCDKVCELLVTGQWFSLDPLVSSTSKTDRHNIAEIMLKVALNTIKPNKNLSISLRDTFMIINGMTMILKIISQCDTHYDTKNNNIILNVSTIVITTFVVQESL
jgi:hypothetical protein